LRADLKQARLKITEAKERHNSLSSSYTKLEDEYESLRDAAETLKWEKAKVEATRKTEVLAIRTRFQDYRVHHHRKLRGLLFHLEKAVNEFGARCLPYPSKNSTIGDIIGQFDNDIKALPAIVAKAI
jgi:predicted nuclease with TOPRIM domain